MSKREAKVLSKYGGKASQNFYDWRHELTNVLEQVCEDALLIIDWVDDQDTMENITAEYFEEWVDEQSYNKADMIWAMKQLYHVLFATTEDVAKEQVQSHQAEGWVRGAKAWKRVQTTAAGLHDNRMQQLLREVSNPVRVRSYDDLAGAIAVWERNLRELESSLMRGCLCSRRLHTSASWCLSSWRRTSCLRSMASRRTSW